MEYSKHKLEREYKISTQVKREIRQEMLYKNKRLLEDLVPIQLPLLEKLKKLYNMRWEKDKLRCPKFDNDVVAIKAKSLLNNTDVYSISKVFITTEYERTHLPCLREFMQQSECFSNDLKIFDKNQQQKLDRLMRHYRFSANFNLGSITDEEINYI